MNRLIALAGVLFVSVGCGLTQSSFSEDFVTAYCDAHDACDRRGRPCPIDLSDDGVSYKDCEFDADLATTCLEATYTCDDSIPENAVVIVPEACYLVCGDEVVE